MTPLPLIPPQTRSGGRQAMAPSPPAEAPSRPRDPRRNRYSVTLVVRVRNMYDNGQGLTPTEIRNELIADPAYDGPIPHLHTIRVWAIPSQADYQRAQNRASARRRRERDGQPMLQSGRLNSEALDQRLLELRDADLTYAAITKVVSLYHGVDRSEYTIRKRLHQLGVSRDERKVRHARSQQRTRTGGWS